MEILSKNFGDSSAKLFTLANADGYELTVTNLGAAITGFLVPARDGARVDAVLGYGSCEGYLRDTAYLGATVGRCANRIAGASFSLNGKNYECDKNHCDKHTLHGGRDSWSKRVWDTVDAESRENAVTFALHSRDGDQGMPGNMRVSVTYALTDDNGIGICYRAVSDRDTIFNPTNHAYFNLEGHDAGDITEHRLQIDADAFTPIDAEGIPTGEIRAVKGTAFDFTTMKPIGRDIANDEEQLRLGNGFDHNFVLNKHSENRPVATVMSEKTGISMSLFTDMPGIQFYSGNGLGGEPQKGGAPLVARGAFCLETQFFPDSIHNAHFPSSVLKAGQVFNSRTEYRFSIAD
jgi:aldose 1-epimerase